MPKKVDEQSVDYIPTDEELQSLDEVEKCDACGGWVDPSTVCDIRKHKNAMLVSRSMRVCKSCRGDGFKKSRRGGWVNGEKN